MHNAPLNAVTPWILNCCVPKVHIRFKRQNGRYQIAFSAMLCHVHGMCRQPEAGKGSPLMQFGLAGR